MIFFVGFSLIYVAFLWWSRFHWNRVPFVVESTSLELKISIILPVRNEQRNIQRLIKDLDLQSYSKGRFDVILVNDNSEDQTVEFAEKAFQVSSLNWQIIHLSEYGLEGKKQAITKGVEISDADIIITTDGDCSLPQNWIAAYAKMYSSGSYQMIAGPVKMIGENFITKLQQVEFAGLVGIGASSLQSGNPGMCNGANLSYKRSAFLEVDGYEGNFEIASGDDEFLLQKIYSKFSGEVGYLKSSDAFILTPAKPTVGELINQRLRWSGKWKFHDSWYIKLMAVLVFANYASVVFAWFSAFLGMGSFWLVTLVFTLRFVSLLFFGIPIMRFFSIKGYFPYVFMLEIIYPFFAVFLGLASIFGHYSWKGRRYS